MLVTAKYERYYFFPCGIIFFSLSALVFLIKNVLSEKKIHTYMYILLLLQLPNDNFEFSENTREELWFVNQIEFQLTGYFSYSFISKMYLPKTFNLEQDQRMSFR